MQTVKHIFGKQFPQWIQSVTVKHSNSSVSSDWASASFFSNGSDLQKFAQFPGIPKAQLSDELCLPTFQLARIKHAQDFADTFLLQVCIKFHAMLLN